MRKSTTILNRLSATLIFSVIALVFYTTEGAGAAIVRSSAPEQPCNKILHNAGYGDSIMLGNTTTPQDSSLGMLQLRLCQIKFDNQGVGGTNALQLLNGTDGKHKPWLQEMKSSQADAIIINHGVNDTYNGNESLRKYTATMESLVKIAQANNKIVILQTPTPVYTSDHQQYGDEPLLKIFYSQQQTGGKAVLVGKEYLNHRRHEALQARAESVRRIARDKHLFLIDANKVMLELTKTVPIEDAYYGVHPTKIGHVAIADEAEKVIKAMLNKNPRMQRMQQN